MKWQVKSMVDPGDGIVGVTIIEHPSDDICEVAADLMNGEGKDAKDGYTVEFFGWIMGLEAMPPEY